MQPVENKIQFLTDLVGLLIPYLCVLESQTNSILRASVILRTPNQRALNSFAGKFTLVTSVFATEMTHREGSKQGKISFGAKSFSSFFFMLRTPVSGGGVTDPGPKKAGKVLAGSCFSSKLLKMIFSTSVGIKAPQKNPLSRCTPRALHLISDLAKTSLRGEKKSLQERKASGEDQEVRPLFFQKRPLSGFFRRNMSQVRQEDAVVMHSAVVARERPIRLSSPTYSISSSVSSQEKAGEKGRIQTVTPLITIPFFLSFTGFISRTLKRKKKTGEEKKDEDDSQQQAYR